MLIVYSFFLIIFYEFSIELSIQAKPVDPIVEAGAQVQQQINLECIDDFDELPSLTIQFVSGGIPHKIPLKLPITINKFLEQTSMNSESFFARWKNLNK